ncbi:MAG: hypothetical protein D6B27_08700 [Gammaproteobacteria bacterium]|nr:MAG: hypothetical protein D6B27_08700 [Gammaproteobacteria bacterium]
MREDSGKYLPFKTGRYELRPLGKNGYCKTAIAIPDSQLISPMYIKFLKPQYAKNKKIKQQFQLEGRILHILNNEQFPHYNEHGLVNNTPYIAYNYLKGMPLSYLFKEKKREVFGNIRFAVGVLSQLLNALKTLHNRTNPIIHGNVNPDNILIGSRGNVYLVDFGCAHLKKNSISKQLLIDANNDYSSPEQMEEEKWSESSDIYQAAALFYEMMTGKRINIIRNFSIKTGNVPENFIEDIVGARLSALIAKMLRPVAQLRVITARRGIEELERIVSGDLVFREKLKE